MMGRGSWGNLTMPGIWDLDDDDKAETLYPIPLGCWPQAQSAKSGFHQKLFILIAFLIITMMRYVHHCHQTHHHWKSPVDHHWEDRWAPQAACWADPLETQRSEGPASDDISPTYHTIQYTDNDGGWNGVVIIADSVSAPNPKEHTCILNIANWKSCHSFLRDFDLFKLLLRWQLAHLRVFVENYQNI